MAEEQEKESKTEEPTQKRLDDARQKGDVAKSMDVPALASLGAACGVLLLAGGWIARYMTEALLPFVAHPEAIDLSGEGSVGVMRAALLACSPVLIVLIGAAVAGAAGNLIQHGLLWVPSKLAPDFSRMGLIKGMGRLFGLDAIVSFLKSLAKVAAIAVIVWMVLKPRIAMLEGLPALSPAAILPLSFELLQGLVIAILCAMTVTAAFDWFWTRRRFIIRMRMTREEIKQDHKESDGDPHVKARQKQIRIQRSRRRMIQNVPKATVVVMNPTHYAVALRYEAGVTAAPVCVAKGVDRLALKIREIAEKHDVPVIEDAPLARALYAAIDVDEVIPQEHYQAVAQVIGFILGEGRKAARRHAPPIPAAAAG
jgi:flagellar biosynthetic protein FlhB